MIIAILVSVFFCKRSHDIGILLYERISTGIESRAARLILSVGEGRAKREDYIIFLAERGKNG